jgi:hypothetical protein
LDTAPRQNVHLSESRAKSALHRILVQSRFVALTAATQSEYRPSTEVDREHTDWIANALRSIQTVKVGMTRADLMTVFTTEGGLSSASSRTYVYRQCPYIKIDVKFAASSRREELPTAKIVELSRPYFGMVGV